MLSLLILAGTLFGGCLSEAMAAERLYDAGDDSGAIRMLQRIQTATLDCADAQWRVAYVRLAEANRETDPEKRLRLWRLGQILSDRCVATYPRSGGAWFVSALSLGVESTFAGPRRRVELSKIVRERVGRSLALDASLPGSWYLLAKWHEGISSLNFVERGFANLLLGGLPEGASQDSAREYLRKAMALRPSTTLVALDLARNLERAGYTADALAICRRASGLSTLSLGDRQNMADLAKLCRRLERSGS